MGFLVCLLGMVAGWSEGGKRKEGGIGVPRFFSWEQEVDNLNQKSAAYEMSTIFQAKLRMKFSYGV